MYHTWNTGVDRWDDYHMRELLLGDEKFYIYSQEKLGLFRCLLIL